MKLSQSENSSAKIDLYNDEPHYPDFIKNPSSIDPFLKRFEGKEGMQYFTYPKLVKSLQDTWWNYHSNLERHFGFRVQKGDWILDIGAHQGLMALNWARLKGRVLAIEPNPINYEILSRNVKLNRSYQIKTGHYAAVSQDGPVTFNFGLTSTTGSLVRSQRDWKRTSYDHEVNGLSLKSILDRFGIDEILLLKVDCEGGEYDFLMNAPLEVLRRAEFLYVEAHPTKEYQPEKLMGYLDSVGYEVRSQVAVHGCYDFFCKRKHGD